MEEWKPKPRRRPKNPRIQRSPNQNKCDSKLEVAFDKDGINTMISQLCLNFSFIQLGNGGLTLVFQVHLLLSRYKVLVLAILRILVCNQIMRNIMLL